MQYLIELLTIFAGKMKLNPANLILIAIMGLNTYELQGTNQRLLQYHEEATYSYPENMMSREFSGLTEQTQVLAQVESWVADGWNAQIAALDILCGQEGRVKLLGLLEKDTATKACRSTL